MTILEQYAEFSASRRLEALTAAERDILGRHLIDTMAAAIVGKSTPTGLALRELSLKGDGTIPVFNRGTIDDVALRVGSVRHTELDDIHMPSNVTPGSIIIPAVLTMASKLAVYDPARVGAALSAGYEAILRLGVAIDGPVVMYRGRWPTYFCASFGAAAATARLMGLSPAQTANALAIALTGSTGGAGRPGPGRAGRWLVVGEAARSGVSAALAAASGFTAQLDLLESGWMRQVHGFEGPPEKLVDAIGLPSVLNELSLKPYCTAKQASSSLAAFEDLLADGLDARGVEKIDVFVPSRYAAMIDRPAGPNAHIGSPVSVRYQFALAAFRPDGLFDVVRANRIDDADFDALMDKITVIGDDALDADMPALWPARVVAESDGRKLEKTVRASPGDPERRFDEAALRTKFHRATTGLVSAGEADGWIASAGSALATEAGVRALADKFDALYA